jgi:alkylated DNA repair dioxygenase AlkB
MDGAKTIDLKKGGKIVVVKKYLTSQETGFYMERFKNGLPWARSPLKLYGKEYLTPRLQCWAGDDGLEAEVYSSNRVNWDEDLLKLKSKLEKDLNFDFNYVLFNQYQTGTDYISYHSDNEVIENTDLIGSLSLGGSRRFLVRERETSAGKEPEKYEFKLEDGDLLVMDGFMQRNYRHSVPKTSLKVDPRINLTWRRAKK